MSEGEHRPGEASVPSAAFAVRGAQRVVVTWVILGLNVAVFAWTLLRGASLMSPSTGDLLAVGANQVSYVAQGQWWRLATCMFVHVGLIHIFVNMFSLRAVGPTAERLFGNGGFSCIYLLSGIGASVASCLWNPGPASAGASGALFGIVGALVAFLLTHKREMPAEMFRSQLKSMLFVVGLNVMIGLSVPMVDNAAHMGGLATGFVAGLCLYRDVLVLPTVTSRQLVRLALLAVLLVAAALMIPIRVAHDPEIGAVLWLEEGQEAVNSKDWRAVREFAVRAMEVSPKSAEAYDLRALALLHFDDMDAASRDLDKAIELDPSLLHARKMRGLLRYEQHENEGALKDLSSAIAIDPRNTWSVRLRGHVLFSLARFDAALRDFQVAARLDDGDAADDQIYAWLCRARLGLFDEADKELTKWSSDLHVDERAPWIESTVAFLTGKTPEGEFIESLPKLEMGEAHDLGCRAAFLAGERRAAHGDLDGARELWERARWLHERAPAGVTSPDAFHATDEISRLDAPSKSPR